MSFPVLTHESRAILADLRERAEARPVTAVQLIDALARGVPPPGLEEDLVQLGIHVFYTIMEIRKGSQVRHLTISFIESAGNPSTDTLVVLAKELGFKIGADLKLTEAQRLLPSPTWGWQVPNLAEAIE